jgi:hypothetical protein
MAHTDREHFKMIFGLQVADLIEQLAVARAQLEALQEEHRAILEPGKAKKPRPPPTKDAAP